METKDQKKQDEIPNNKCERKMCFLSGKDCLHCTIIFYNVYCLCVCVVDVFMLWL